MDRNHVLNLMSELELRGMRASYDEVLADGASRHRLHYLAQELQGRGLARNRLRHL